jgi:hypothetical protein
VPISWNEIRQNAIAFSKEWAAETREHAEAKSFWDEFFAVFGVRRRTVASFEEPVKKLSGAWGFIDLFWPGTLLVEHKSLGKPLDVAQSQAMAYIRGLKDAGRDDDIPRYVVLSDFASLALHDLDERKSFECSLKELHKHVHVFAFIPGYKQHRLDVEDPINVKAVEKMGELHDALEDGGYAGHQLERFLVRVLFCLFAEDNGIFDRNAFTQFVEERTNADGSDLGAHLARIFSVLNTPTDHRQRNLDELLASLPYVNGDLFAEHLEFVEFTRSTREALLSCCRFDWSRISPAIFGSLFQSVIEPRERRQVGAHYTSERDIMKVVRSLFLDDLRAEFERIKKSKPDLRRFHDRLAKLRFFDPACGCGNFLVVTYRELRLLELDVLLQLQEGDRQLTLDISHMARVDVDAFIGVEINEFPVRIAEVAMWLMDHQMNLRVSEAFGQYFVRLPLRKSAKIVQGNALRLDWRTIVAPEECSYVLGNPPFVGSKYQSESQRSDMKTVASTVKNVGLLDYVTGWYFQAAGFIRGTNISVGFVSTNSITQGEQVGTLWADLLKRGLQIRFAHRTFAWESEARGKAHVHVVIIGFGENVAGKKRLYDYESDPNTPTVIDAKNISPYLVEGPDTLIVNRETPVCAVPKIAIGNKPIDDGNYLFLEEEMDQFLKQEPKAKKWFRQWVGSDEFINGKKRWCLWLGDCPPQRTQGDA